MDDCVFEKVFYTRGVPLTSSGYMQFICWWQQPKPSSPNKYIVPKHVWHTKKSLNMFFFQICFFESSLVITSAWNFIRPWGVFFKIIPRQSNNFFFRTINHFSWLPNNQSIVKVWLKLNTTRHLLLSKTLTHVFLYGMEYSYVLNSFLQFTCYKKSMIGSNRA